jgi:hypothetical protein
MAESGKLAIGDTTDSPNFACWFPKERKLVGGCGRRRAPVGNESLFHQQNESWFVAFYTLKYVDGKKSATVGLFPLFNGLFGATNLPTSLRAFLLALGEATMLPLAVAMFSY